MSNIYGNAVDIYTALPYICTMQTVIETRTYIKAAIRAGLNEAEIAAIVEAGTDAGEVTTTTYAKVRAAAGAQPVDLGAVRLDRPRLSESWFCCAEPTEAQVVRLRS